MQALLDSSHALLGEEGRGFFINGNAEILSSNVCEDMSAMLKANYPKSLRCRVYNMEFSERPSKRVQHLYQLELCTKLPLALSNQDQVFDAAILDPYPAHFARCFTCR